MVDALTPCLATFGVNKEERKPDEDWDSAGGWLPFALAIGAGSDSEAAGSGSLSAGCLAGMDASWAVTSDSDPALGETGGLRLSLYPISPRLVGNGSACGRTVEP